MDDIATLEAAVQERREQRRKFAQDELASLDAAKEVQENPRTRGWFADMAASALRGPIKAALAVGRITEMTGDVRINVGNDKPFFEVLSPSEVQSRGVEPGLEQLAQSGVDTLGAPQTTAGSLTEGVTQFLTGFKGLDKVGKAFTLLKGARASTAVAGLTKGAITSALAFEGHEQNLANLVQAFPTLQNPVTEFLATDANDSEIVGRLKNAVTDAGGGVVVEGFISSLRALKGMRRAKAEGTPNETPSDPTVTPEAPSADSGSAPASAGDDLTLSLDEPLPTTRQVVEDINHDPRLKLETDEQEAARLVNEQPVVDDVAAQVEAGATKIEQQAKRVQEEAKVLTEQSQPKPFRELSPEEQYSSLREKLGISDAKMDEFRSLAKAGKIGPEKVADLIGANPERLDWSNVTDAEDMVGMLNTLTRILGDATGEAAGYAPQTLDQIAEHTAKIGGSFDDAVRTWQGTRNLAAHVQAGRAAVAGSGKLLSDLGKKIAGGKATAQEILDFAVQDKRHALLQVTVRGTRAEIGRALRVMREGVSVSESANKLANGRRLRAARKASEAVDAAAGVKQVAQQGRALKETAKAEADVATKATQAADAADTKAVAAEQEIVTIEQTIKVAEQAREKAARRAGNRAMHELDVEHGSPQATTLTLEQSIRAADEVVKKNRLEGELAGARKRAQEARAEAKAARAAQREADKVAAKAAKEADAFANKNAKLFDKVKGAEVNLEGDLKLQMDEVEAALQDMGLRTQDVVDLAKLYADSADVNAASRSALQGAGVTERLSSLYINNILSGLPTMALNISSGFYKLIESTLENFGSAALGAIRGGDRFDRVVAMKSTVAAFTSWRGAWKAAGAAWKEGLPQTDILARHEVTARGGSVITGNAKADAVLTAPSRAIMTIDEFFKHIFAKQELTARAVEVAASAARLQPTKALQDKMYAKVLKETMDNPPDDLVLDAIEQARYNTFQGNLESQFAKNLTRLTNETPLTKFIIPFIKTPVNILKQGVLERTPLAFARQKFWQDVKAGGRQGRTTAFRALLGTAAVGTVWNLASDGNITGSKKGIRGNKNTGDSEIPAYSVKIGDTWYQYNRLDPMGAVLGLVVDLREASDSLGDRLGNELASDDPGLGEVFSGLMTILNENLTDKTFFKGLSDFFGAVSGEDGLATNYVNGIAGNMLPYSSMMRNLAKSHDGYAREAWTVMEKVQAQIPGLSNDLPARRDILGRPIKNVERLGADWVSPFLVGKDDADPAAKALAEVEMAYRMPQKNIAGVQLDPKQYSRLLEVRGSFVHEQLTNAIQAGDWSQLTKYQRMDMMRQIFSVATRKGEHTVLTEWPEVGSNVLALKQETLALRAGGKL